MLKQQKETILINKIRLHILIPIQRKGPVICDVRLQRDPNVVAVLSVLAAERDAPTRCRLGVARFRAEVPDD